MFDGRHGAFEVSIRIERSLISMEVGEALVKLLFKLLVIHRPRCQFENAILRLD
jgi:hypothetical protein